jgi:predicted phage terminase large subunit-like protein
MAGTLQETLLRWPHLASPAALGRADMGAKWVLPPHLALLNHELMQAWATPDARLMVNVAYRHGKSYLSSHYFPAWALLLWPETRFIFVSHSDSFSALYGSKVKNTIERFGRELGVSLQKDSRAKAEWVTNAGGGMVCRGWKGSVIGRGADCLLMDDLIKNIEQAISSTILDRQWEFYSTVAYSRLEPGGKIVNVGTRWVTGDVFGRALKQAEETGEVWRVVKLKALAEADDPLGRKPGEALWPQRHSAASLRVIEKANPRWFRAGWQQEPEDEKGLWFQPYGEGGWPNVAWPRWENVAGAYSCHSSTGVRRIFRRWDCIHFVTLDWAWSKKKTADFSGLGAWALLPDSRLALLEACAVRVGLHGLAPELEKFCWLHSPAFVGAETGHPTLSQDYRSYKGIPEVRWISPAGKNKKARALSAIIMCEAGDVLVPAGNPSWLKTYLDQMKAFTGDENKDEHDDLLDMTSSACNLARLLRARKGGQEECFPEVLIPGREIW